MKKVLSLLLAMLFLSLCLFGCETTAHLKEKLNARITRGTINGNTYTSEFTGITFTKPDHWRYFTDEEIAEVLDIGLEAMDANAFEKTVAEYSGVNDMMAINDATGQNVSIAYENLSLTVGKSISEEDYYNLLKDSLTSFGYIPTGGQKYVSLSGKEYLKVSFNGTNNNVDFEMTTYIRLIGDIMVCIMVTTPTGIIDNNLEDMFS